MPRKNRRKPLGEMSKNDARELLAQAFEVMFSDDEDEDDTPPPAPEEEEKENDETDTETVGTPNTSTDKPPREKAVEDEGDDEDEDDIPAPPAPKPTGGPRLRSNRVISEEEQILTSTYDDYGQRVPAGTI